MPVQLEVFKNIAARGGNQQVLLAGPGGAQADEIRTRGSIYSFVVNLFRDHEVRREQQAVAQAYIQALQNELGTATGEVAQLSDALKTDYTIAMQQALGAVRDQLANQLEGTQALTTHDIRSTLGFIVEVQQQILEPLMAEAHETRLIEVADQRLQALQALTASLHGAPEQEGSAGEHLAHYLSGGSYSGDALATIAQQVSDLVDAFGQVKQSLTDLRALPGGPAAHPDLQGLMHHLEAALEDQTPVDILKWFNESHRRMEVAQGHLDATCIRLGSGGEVLSERTPRQLIEAFRQGEKLSEADRGFLDKWAHQFISMANNLTWVFKMSEGDKDLRTRLNQLSTLSEARFGAIAGGAIEVDPELLNGAGGTSATPFQDQSAMALWARRDVQVALLQDVSLLRKQVDAIVAAGGDVSQLAGDLAKAFEPKTQNDLVFRLGEPKPGDDAERLLHEFRSGEDAERPLHEPNSDAVPQRSALRTTHAHINPVSVTTAEYHQAPPGSAEDEVGRTTLSNAAMAERANRVAALNAELGLSADGKARVMQTPHDFLPEAGGSFVALARNAGVDADALSTPQKELYRMNLSSAMHYRQAQGAGRGEFGADDAARMATQHLRYVAGLTPSQAVGRQRAWAEMREVGTQFLSVLAEGAPGAQGGTLLKALSDKTHELMPEIVTNLNPSRNEMGSEELEQIRWRAAISVTEGLAPEVARRLLDTIFRPDSVGRATLLMLGASTSARSPLNELAASLNANGSYTEVNFLIRALAGRAGVDDVQPLLNSTIDAGVDLSTAQAQALLDGTASAGLAAALERAGLRNRSALAQAREVVNTGFSLRQPDFVAMIEATQAAGQAGSAQT